MNCVFHIAPRSHWQQAQQVGVYRASSLETEGFIHCSTVSQVIRTANTFFQGQRDLVLLRIDPARLNSELRYDVIETGERFPHLYGALNLNAVTQVIDFEPSSDGTFTLPALL
jgi:uncharacterized protein (DUF952 family)